MNALCPGVIDTPMLHEFAATRPDPDDCADAALWLVSDDASFVTGVALPVDGGFTAM